MKATDATKRDRFLKELTALTRRYKIDIGGCGCCGSPFLTDIKDTKGRRYHVDDDSGRLSFYASDDT